MSNPMSSTLTRSEFLEARCQPGILLEVPPLARYLVFKLVEMDQTRFALQSLRDLVDDRTVAGLSESLVESLDANIPGLKSFPALVGAGIEVPATSGSLWLWLRGQDRGELVHRTRRLE